MFEPPLGPFIQILTERPGLHPYLPGCLDGAGGTRAPHVVDRQPLQCPGARRVGAALWPVSLVGARVPPSSRLAVHSNFTIPATSGDEGRQQGQPLEEPRTHYVSLG